MPVAFLKPNPDKKLEGKVIKVKDPIKNDWLPETGRLVQLSIYWLQRLRHGEVIRCDADDAGESEKTLAEKLDDMTKAKLVEYAKENLNLELDSKNNKQSLIDMIIAETDLQNSNKPLDKSDIVLDNMAIDELKQFAVDNDIEIVLPEGKDETKELVLELVQAALDAKKTQPESEQLAADKQENDAK